MLAIGLLATALAACSPSAVPRETFANRGWCLWVADNAITEALLDIENGHGNVDLIGLRAKADDVASSLKSTPVASDLQAAKDGLLGLHESLANEDVTWKRLDIEDTYRTTLASSVGEGPHGTCAPQ